MNRFTLTTPIFYVNAKPHIGHAYTVVAADVLARFHRLRGDDVFFLAGTDEHGAKVAEAAAVAGKSPQAFADEIAATFRTAWSALNIDFSDFIRTTERRHEEGVRKVLERLHADDLLYQKTYRGLYCTGCEKFVTEKDLDEQGFEPLHKRKPTVVEETNWFFKLSQFLPRVRTAIEENTLRILPEARKNEVFGLLDVGLEDLSISRSRERVSWGIPLPFDDTQVTYVWFDALLNYITALGYGSADESNVKKYWPADVQVIGQDILKFHAVYWPAILFALGLDAPRTLLVHGFFTVNGEKISKSLGNVIDPLELLARYGADATRYLLLSQFPFGTSGDVEAHRFDERYDAVLANTVGNLVSRTVTLVQKFSGGHVPNASRDTRLSFPALDAEIAGELGGTIDLRVRAPIEWAAQLNQYIDQAAPWRETDAQKRDQCLRTIIDGVAHLGLLLEPVLPQTAKTIQRAFHVIDGALPGPDTQITPMDPPILFPKSSTFPKA